MALLEQRYKYEASLKQLEDQLAACQLQLKQTTERSAKLRQQNDRCARGPCCLLLLLLSVCMRPCAAGPEARGCS